MKKHPFAPPREHVPTTARLLNVEDADVVNDRIDLATVIVRRDARLLLVASRYPNLPNPLWNLPGGRREPGESFADAARRELAEETGLAGAIGSLCYASESRDPQTGTHYLNLTFEATADGEPFLAPGDAHAVELAWVPLADLATRLRVAVVREPLLAYLAGDSRRYYALGIADVTIRFAPEDG